MILIKKFFSIFSYLFFIILFTIIFFETTGLIYEKLYTDLKVTPYSTDYNELKKLSNLYDTNYDFKNHSDSLQKLYQLLEFDYYKHYRLPRNFSSKYINTNYDRLRVTKNYEKKQDHETIKIGFFGGSTMFGIGSESDNETIPSLVSKLLNQNNSNFNFEIFNFGVNGYNNSQEILYFLEIYKNYDFDFVFFYDFVNESIHISHNEALKAGYLRSDNFLTPIAQWELIVKFLKTHNNAYLFIDLVNNRSFTVKIFRKILSYFNLLNKTGFDIPKQTELDVKETDKYSNYDFLIKRLINIYVRNMEIIYSISQIEKINAYFILQPSLYTKKNLSDFEKNSIYNSKNFEWRRQIESRVYNEAKKIEYPYKVNDFTSIFDNFSSTIFIDDHHISKKGSQIISEKLVKIILNDLQYN